MPSDALNPGNVGVMPAPFRELLGRLITVALEHVPEEHQPEAQAEFAAVLDTIIAKPAKAGETILVGEAAAEALRAAFVQALDEARRTRGEEA